LLGLGLVLLEFLVALFDGISIRVDGAGNVGPGVTCNSLHLQDCPVLFCTPSGDTFVGGGIVVLLSFGLRRLLLDSFLEILLVLRLIAVAVLLLLIAVTAIVAVLGLLVIVVRFLLFGDRLLNDSLDLLARNLMDVIILSDPMVFVTTAAVCLHGSVGHGVKGTEWRWNLADLAPLHTLEIIDILVTATGTMVLLIGLLFDLVVFSLGLLGLTIGISLADINVDSVVDFDRNTSNSARLATMMTTSITVFKVLGKVNGL
jgi:hypothetical protein